MITNCRFLTMHCKTKESLFIRDPKPVFLIIMKTLTVRNFISISCRFMSINFVGLINRSIIDQWLSFDTISGSAAKTLFRAPTIPPAKQAKIELND